MTKRSTRGKFISELRKVLMYTINLIYNGQIRENQYRWAHSVQWTALESVRQRDSWENY